MQAMHVADAQHQHDQDHGNMTSSVQVPSSCNYSANLPPFIPPTENIAQHCSAAEAVARHPFVYHDMSDALTAPDVLAAVDTYNKTQVSTHGAAATAPQSTRAFTCPIRNSLIISPQAGHHTQQQPSIASDLLSSRMYDTAGCLSAPLAAAQHVHPQAVQSTAACHSAAPSCALNALLYHPRGRVNGINYEQRQGVRQASSSMAKHSTSSATAVAAVSLESEAVTEHNNNQPPAVATTLFAAAAATRGNHPSPMYSINQYTQAADLLTGCDGPNAAPQPLSTQQMHSCWIGGQPRTRRCQLTINAALCTGNPQFGCDDGYCSDKDVADALQRAKSYPPLSPGECPTVTARPYVRSTEEAAFIMFFQR